MTTQTSQSVPSISPDLNDFIFGSDDAETPANGELVGFQLGGEVVLGAFVRIKTTGAYGRSVVSYQGTEFAVPTDSLARAAA